MKPLMPDSLYAGENGQPPAAKRILIVDDEPAILFAYRKLIEREGMAVDICDCLSAALNNINTRPYFAVIADLRLAGSDCLDGLQLINAIREIRPETRIILATGYGSWEIEQAARGQGVSHYFEKPVQPAEILAVLKELFDAAGQDR